MLVMTFDENYNFDPVENCWRQCRKEKIISFLLVAFAASALAYAANRTSRRNDPLLMCFVAFLFPEIYLFQAGLRAVSGDWQLMAPQSCL